MTEPNRTPAPAERLIPFRWPLTVAVLGLLVLIAILAVLWALTRGYRETLDAGAQAGHYAAEKLQTIAERFSQGTITRTFTAALPNITTDGAGKLELATAEATETLHSEDERLIFWNTLSLGRTITEIRVPVTYRFHVRLNDPWRLDVSGQTCVVHAPAIRPSLPPAIHTDRMEKRSEAGWARFNAGEQMDELERSLTPTLARYAADPRHIALVREQSRNAVAGFVRDWLLREDHWRKDRFREIKVIFADETAGRPDTVQPVLRLQ